MAFDGEFLTAIAEHPSEILKCAMYLFMGYLDGATRFAQSCNCGGSDISLPWGRKDEDEIERARAAAARLGKTPKSGRKL